MRELLEVTKDRIEFLDSRFYRHVNGDFYPSVTTILDAYPKNAAFYEWLKRMGNDADEIRDEAGRKGSRVHDVCEEYDNEMLCSILGQKGEPIYRQIEWAMFERYVEFRKRIGFTLIANEVHYVSPTLGFAGTLDRVFEWQGKRILVDIKTSNALHNHYWLQLAAYCHLWQDLNPAPIDEIAILWLNSKTRTEGIGKSIQGAGWKLYQPEKSIDHYWGLFQSVHAIWKAESGDTKPRNTSYQLTHQLKQNGTEKINRANGHLQKVN
jgi:hypothetical protein